MKNLNRAIVLLSLLLTLYLSQSVYAQPFDTLLQQFHQIREIYPLEDSTYILIGEGEDVRVEMVNRNAETIWSTVLSQKKLVDIIKHKVHLMGHDSSIQVMTARRNCDFYGPGNAVIYTLSFAGNILDSLLVPFTQSIPYVALLSGSIDRPAIAYIEGKDVVLSYHNGDTIHLQLSFFDGDTTNSFLIGNPKLVAMCPDGSILIGDQSSFTFRYLKQDNGYKVIDFHSSSQFEATDLFCLEDDAVIYVYEGHIRRWHHGLPVQEFHPGESSFIVDVTQRGPFLILTVDGFGYSDSVYVLDHSLNRVYGEPMNSTYTQFAVATAIFNNHSFYAGYGYALVDGGFVGSFSHETTEGPIYDDVALIDVEIGDYVSSVPVDTCSFLRTNLYYSGINITIANHGESTLSSLDVNYLFEVGCCKPDSWVRTLADIELLPNETKTYFIPDIYFTRFNSGEEYRPCVYLSRPNRRHDDHPADNTICREIKTNIESIDLSDWPIYPNPASVNIYLQMEDYEQMSIKVFDFFGREVLEKVIHKGHLNVSSLPSGWYLVQSNTQDGKLYNGKFLKL